MLKFEQRPAEHGRGVPTVTPASTESTNNDNGHVVLWRRGCGLVWECWLLLAVVGCSLESNDIRNALSVAQRGL
jgi:hypothetical protein